MLWPADRLGEALEVLARRGGLAPRSIEAPFPPPRLADENGVELGRWIEAAAIWLDIEAEPTAVEVVDLEGFLRTAGPAVLRLPGGGDGRFLALLDGARSHAVVVSPDRIVHRVPLESVAATLCGRPEPPVAAELERLLDEAGVPERRRRRARAHLLRERIGAAPVGDGWLLRPRPGGSFWRLLRFARLPSRLAAVMGVHTLQYFLWILSWLWIGRADFQGRLDRTALCAWALLLLTQIPLRLVMTWSVGMFAVGAGGILRQRLLHGLLQLRTEETRHQGSGQFLGRVIGSEAVESLALSGGILGIVAGIELAGAIVILGAGAAGGFQAPLLLIWVALALLLGWEFLRRRRRWAGMRLALTHDLVERMVGHRTRLAQETRERWHEAEDQSVEHYLDASKSMDRVSVLLMAVVPRGWLALGLAGLAPAYVAGQVTQMTLAIGLGGVLLAFQALEKLAAGVRDLVEAKIAWEQVAPLYHAAARQQDRHSPDLVWATARDFRATGNAQPIVEGIGLIFRYRDRGEAVLRACHLRIDEGDRLLLEGSSGSGKSTLAAVLAGLRKPESGLLLYRGLDRQTLGIDGWRRRVVLVPQFHENHVLTETLAFNLLMGRRWPPRQEDLREAETVCRQVGLGDLLDRMPAGIFQVVGESGWQLSHGERSRLHIARALLQRADLIALDESFAALDPESFRQTFRCVLDRARTVLVIAHP